VFLGFSGRIIGKWIIFTDKSSRKVLMVSKLLVIKEFIQFIKSSFPPKVTPLAKFCRIFETKMRARLESSDGGSANLTEIYIQYNTANYSETFWSNNRRAKKSQKNESGNGLIWSKCLQKFRYLYPMVRKSAANKNFEKITNLSHFPEISERIM
jgi:hypothetical protein